MYSGGGATAAANVGKLDNEVKEVEMGKVMHMVQVAGEVELVKVKLLTGVSGDRRHRW